jgi:hypothetical protein
MKRRGDSNTGKEASGQSADCNTCAHFFITWDKRYPYGCRAMNFMSSNSPNKDVFEVEGRDCLTYRSKQSSSEEKENSEIDFGGGKSRIRKVNVIV